MLGAMLIHLVCISQVANMLGAMLIHLVCILQVANMLGAMLSKEEVDDFMKEADVVSFYLLNN